MPAGKIPVTSGMAWVSRHPHFGISIRSMRCYAKRSTPALSVNDLEECRKKLRKAFRRYIIDCSNVALTATEQRKKLNQIKSIARRFLKNQTWDLSQDLLTALNTRSGGVRTLVFNELKRMGHDPVRFHYEFVHWTGVFTPFPKDCVPALTELAALDVEGLVPEGGRFPDPALANLVAQLVPIWKKVTGRTAGRISVGPDCEQKKCHFAEWLAKMHDLLGIVPPPVGRVLDIAALP